jgi:hypothetical protein
VEAMARKIADAVGVSMLACDSESGRAGSGISDMAEDLRLTRSSELDTLWQGSI